MTSSSGQDATTDAVAVVVRRVWRDVFGRGTVTNAGEEALFQHLMDLCTTATAPTFGTERGSYKDITEEKLATLLRDDMMEKMTYLDPSWGYIDAAAIVSSVDECAIALQATTKRAFMDPITWDHYVPHGAVIATVKAVLLLFDMNYPMHLTDENIWKKYWALWIFKNIDAHTSGWEWATTNEPMGLFTKPYTLCSTFLPRVQKLLQEAACLAPGGRSHRCWHRMDAYACLYDWAQACVLYVHMKTHVLPGFPAYDDVQQLLAPPRRTPQANVWFRLATPEGIDYYYNRIKQEIVLEKPDGFDGITVTSIPLVVQELAVEALKNDHATRLELERRSHQKVHDKLLAEDEWVQCFDYRTQQVYYYSFQRYRVSHVPPPSGVFLSHTESVAYQAVLSLQTAYRKRRLRQILQIKRNKRASLPMLSSLSTNKKYY